VKRGLRRLVCVWAVLGTLVACGSRTGLFVPSESEIIVDASTGFDAPSDFDVTFPDDRNFVPDVIEEPVGCRPGTFSLSPATSQIMFVLDRSRSMLYRLDANVEAQPGETSRWAALRNALSTSLTPFESSIAMGARFFPQVNADGDAPGACQQDTEAQAIAPAYNNAQTILNVFDTTTPTGGTPTAGALGLAAQEQGQRRAIARVMVLATDGAPNCNPDLDPDTCVCTAQLVPGEKCEAANPGDGSNCLDDTNTVGAIKQIAEQQKIPVFVVGIGVTADFANTLNAMAQAGGRPRAGSPSYYPAETPAELTNAFEIVRDSVAKCTYVTPSAPQDPNAITLDINGRLLKRDPTHTDGWDWIDQEYGQLQLYGTACTSASPTNVSGTVECRSSDL
jgi:hypothetical protein